MRTFLKDAPIDKQSFQPISRELSKPPVFIVGCSRTGSTLLQEIFDHHSPVDMMPEAHFLTPLWIHKDVRFALRRVKATSKIEFADMLLDLMYSRELFGVFWQEVICASGIDKDLLRERLIANGQSLQGVFHSVMEAHATSKGKTILGAKFPLYICYAKKLVEWYPNCRIIHTIRDPRAIFASQYYKRRHDKSGKIRQAAEGIVQFVHINSQYYWALRTHSKMKMNKSYHLCRYEDLVNYPEDTLRGICSFLAIPFESKMLSPRAVMNTSFIDVVNTSGMENVENRTFSKQILTSSVNLWKRKLPRSISRTIEIMNASAMKEFGYSQSIF